MADVIRVKAKKKFQWEQDNKYVFVKVPMPGHTIIKNLEIFLSDLILRITSKQKKNVQTLDLAKQIDYLSPENKFLLAEGVVRATLKKKVPNQQWTQLLVQDISLAQLKVRQKQSMARYDLNTKQAEELKDKLKNEYDRKATQQLMRFEEEERKKLQSRKNEEKQAALNEVFRNVNEKTGKIQYQGNKWEEKGKKALQQLERQQQEARQRIKKQKIRLQQEKYLSSQANRQQPPIPNNKNIFTEQDIKAQEQIAQSIEEEIQEAPIRKQAKINLKFTQKLYPNVATRDYHYTEPPMPKEAAPLPPPRQGDLQNRNPLWLKDRGDRFMRDKNYSSALDAYNEALKMDSNNKKILMNRSLSHLKLLNFDSAISDCEQILLQIQKQLVNSQSDKQQSLGELVRVKMRKSLCLAWKGKLNESKQILLELLSYRIDEKLTANIEQNLDIIKRRQQSNTLKEKGDQLVKNKNYEQAISVYNRSLNIDNNQYALSNKTLCLIKLGRYEESLQLCDKGIPIIQSFLSHHSSVRQKQYSNLLIKLQYRKGNALEMLGRYKQAEVTLKKALQYDPEDKDVKAALLQLKSRQEALQFAKLKQQASSQVKNNNPQLALNLYGKCLKLCESPERISDYLSILQNQSVCYLKLQQFDNIIGVCIRILNIVNNHKNKIVQFGGKKDYGLNREALDKISIRTLVRRANAYLKSGQVYNAKSDLEKAAQIDPKDESVKKQLQKLKASLGKN